MVWIKRIWVLSAVLLCTGFLLASNAPPQDVDRATALSAPLVYDGLTANEAPAEGSGAPRDGDDPTSGECLGGGCTNFTTLYPSATQTTTSTAFVTISTCMYGSDYAKCNVTGGTTYEWSMCTADGGATPSWDAQLTLANEAGTTLYCYSDNYCVGYSSGINAPKIQWTAPSTQVVRVLVSKYNCTSGSNCNTLRWRVYVPPCSVTCPGGALTEPEPCGTHGLDDGCNVTPNVFVDILPGQTYCGWADTYTVGTTNYRDTDWYRITTTQWTQITWQVAAEFPVAAFIISGACGDLTVENAVYGLNCVPVSAVKCLPEGTYYLFVSLGTSAGGIFTGYPCTAYSDYWATLTCAPCSAPTSYCTATATTCDEYVSRVQVDAIDNASTCTTGGYANYLAIVGTIAVGTNYQITVTNGYPYSTDYCGVWVDWNHDNYFAYPEKVAMAVNPGLGPYTGTILAPPGALMGQTRMRVRINYAAAAPACGNTTYGETEDYTINLVEAMGACCLPAAPWCQVTLEANCTGTFMGTGSTCSGPDCQPDGIPDLCQLEGHDCNGNEIPDECDIANCPPGQLWCQDCQGDGIPDGCQLETRADVINESFEGATFPPTGWTNIALDVNGPWQVSTNTAYVHTGLQSAVHPWSTPDTADSYLLTPELNLTEATLHVWSIGCFGQTWCDYYDIDLMIVVGDPGGGDDIFVGNLNELWTDSFITWVEAVYDLTPLLPAGPFKIGFRYYGLDGDLGVIDDVRVEGPHVAPANDCNENGIPDECDIGTAWGGFCTGPDCSRDCNDNDVPDECEELIWCDLNGNGVVEDEPPYYDYWLFIDALGACQGNPKYNACADHDGDGCVTLLDYCDWVDCFREANGKDWVPPPTERKNPAPRPVPAVPARPAPVGR